MTAPASLSSEQRTGFFLPAIGLIMAFAALAPAVGGVVFLPLALWLTGIPAVVAAAAHVGWAALAFGHVAALVPAYVVGLPPAAAAGLIFALWDYFAPPRWPRALAAAAIGAVLANGIAEWIAHLGLWLFAAFGSPDVEFDGPLKRIFSPEFALALRHALVASGAIAGLACAAAANLVGLSAWKVVERRPS